MGIPDVRGPVTPASPRRTRRVAAALTVVVLLVAAGGAISFRQFVTRTKSDPGFIYRDRTTFEKLYKLARQAEDHGDRGTAVTNYRFLVAVGANRDSALEPYVVAARAGLARLTSGAPDTPSGRPR